VSGENSILPTRLIISGWNPFASQVIDIRDILFESESS